MCTFNAVRALEFPDTATSPQATEIASGIKIHGHSGELPIRIAPELCDQVVEYFSSRPSHVNYSYSGSHGLIISAPLIELKAAGEMLPKHLTYSTEDHLNCAELAKIAVEPLLIEIAWATLGCEPRLEFMNTFWTLPSDDETTLSDFHRDFDDYLCLTVMINWTDKHLNQSGTEFIRGTHRPSPELTAKLRATGEELFSEAATRNLSDQEIFDLFRQSTVPGYRQNPRYQTLFPSSEDYSIASGRQGSIFCLNNEGLHRGPVFQGEHLISWVRYGTSGGYPGCSSSYPIWCRPNTTGASSNRRPAAISWASCSRREDRGMTRPTRPGPQRGAFRARERHAARGTQR